MTTLTLDANGLSVVALGAHPDDIEIGCGGTLLALARRGSEIRSMILTGTPDRQAEARDAAASFGVAGPPRFANLEDARLPASWNAAKDALHGFREEVPSPDIIFAPRTADAHQDHRLLGRLVSTVWRGPLLLHYEIPKWDGDYGRPNFYVPLTVELARRKVSLLNSSFPSQHSRDWWDDEFFLSILRLRGAEVPTRYAEAFTTTKMAVGLQ